MFKSLEIKILLSIIAVALLFSSCGDETKSLDTDSFGYEYYPIEAGKFWIYKMDETLIKLEGNGNTTSTYFLREDVTESFVNTVGDTIFKIQRSISDTQDGAYATTDIWTAEATREGIYRVEENLEFVKMIFPFKVGTSWEGNLFDNLTEVNVAETNVWVYKDWGNYEVASKGIPFAVEGENYPTVTKIDQANFVTSIERRYAVEYYAEGVGLIQKEMEIYDTQCPCPGQSWIQKAEAGFKLTQTLVDHN